MSLHVWSPLRCSWVGHLRRERGGEGGRGGRERRERERVWEEAAGGGGYLRAVVVTDAAVHVVDLGC
jgi:hypothetical protein